MREFGFQLPLSLPLCVGGGCFLRFWCRDLPGTQVAQTLCFPGFNTCPPTGLAFKAFLVQNRALAAVWRTGVLQTTCFLERIGPWAPSTPKVCSFLILFVCTLRKPL